MFVHWACATDRVSCQRGSSMTLLTKSACTLKNKKTMARGHFKRTKTHIKAQADSIRGAKSYRWIGDKIGYTGIHTWLRREFGKADRCENKKCSAVSKNFNWALRKGYRYERRRGNFIRLCRSCHLKYDFGEDFKIWKTKSRVRN